MITSEEKEGGGINWEVGMDIYTLLYINWVTNKDLLYIAQRTRFSTL